MKATVTTFILLLAAPLVTIGVAADDAIPDPKKLTDEQLWDIYYDFVAKVKPYGVPADRQEHEKKMKPTLQRIDRGFETVMCMSYARINNDRMWVDIDDFTGEIRYYMNRGIGADWSSGNKARMTEEQVTEKAKSFLFLNTGLKLKEYSVRYKPPEKGTLHSVVFRRKLGDYLFRSDCISMDVSEKYGLMSYQNVVAFDDCDTELKITEEEATKLAVKYIEELESKRRRKMNNPEKESADLRIVSPELLRVEPSIYKTSMVKLRKTRVAWRLFYSEQVSKENLQARLHEVTSGFVYSDKGLTNSVFLYIDAITGELLHFSYAFP